MEWFRSVGVASKSTTATGRFDDVPHVPAEGATRPRKCTSASGGTTPPLISTEITYVEEEETEDGVRVSYEQDLWVGVELGGDHCIWYGEENFEICGKLAGCRGVPSPNPLGVPSPKEALEIAEDILDDIEENASEIRLPAVAAGDLLLSMVALVVLGFIVFASLAGTTVAIAIAGITFVVVTAQELQSDDREQD